jgi:tetratricopeptide (TPR) repeat protein
LTSSPVPLSDRPQTWAAYFLLLAALSALCFGSLAGHLLDTHDAQTFQDHLRISQDWTFFFSPDKAQASGRPFAEAVKYLAYLLWGNDPRTFHLLVVAAHTFASLLWALVCQRLGMSLELSLTSGLLFLVNVTHFQAVHHISALDYPLALICGLASICCYLQALQSGSWKWWAGFYSGVILGLMAHLSIGVVVPFCLYWAWREGGEIKGVLRRFLPLSLLVVLALSLLLYLTSAQTSTWRSLELYSVQGVGTLLAGMARILLWFTSRLWTTAHWMPLPVYTREDWELYVGGAALFGLGWLVWKNHRPLSWGAAWILLSLLPFLLLTETTINDMPAGPSRYLYLSSAGSSVLLAWLLGRLSLGLGRLVKPWIPLAGLMALLVLSSYVSLKRAEALSLYTSGRNYVAQGNPALGIAQLQRALAQDRGVLPLQDVYRRLCFLLLGREEAGPLLDEALRRFPRDFYLNLCREAANSLNPDPLVRQQAQERINDFIRQRQASPGATTESLVAQSYFNLAFNLEERGEQARAALAYRQALTYDPGSAKAQKHLVEIYRQLMAQDLASATDEVYAAMGTDLLNLGQLDEAIQACRRALQKNERHPAAQASLGKALYLKGDLLGALSHYGASMRLRPSSAAQFGLGLAHLRAGQVAEARRAYAEGVRYFGAAEAERSGAVEDLKALLREGVQAAEARALLETYWP